MTEESGVLKLQPGTMAWTRGSGCDDRLWIDLFLCEKKFDQLGYFPFRQGLPFVDKCLIAV